jgi:hypothetical protein
MPFPDVLRQSKPLMDLEANNIFKDQKQKIISHDSALFQLLLRYSTAVYTNSTEQLGQLAMQAWEIIDKAQGDYAHALGVCERHTLTPEEKTALLTLARHSRIYNPDFSFGKENPLDTTNALDSLWQQILGFRAFLDQHRPKGRSYREIMGG